jgi:hypothetical protein
MIGAKHTAFQDLILEDDELDMAVSTTTLHHIPATIAGQFWDRPFPPATDCRLVRLAHMIARNAGGDSSHWSPHL